MKKHKAMVKALAKSGDEIAEQMSGHQAHLLHMAIGISGEVGEILEALRHQPVDQENLVEELGDLEFYLEGFRQGTNLERETKEGELNWSLVHSATDLAVSAGGLLDQVKKYAIYNLDPMSLKFKDTLKTLEEDLADLYRTCRVGRERALQANIDKLAIRYPGFQYSDDAAQARADKAPGN